MQPEAPAHEAAFAPALLDPRRAIPTGLVGAAATSRFNVYRNNVIVSLIDALADIYPAVQRITGAEFFRAMARFHIRATPPASPLLFEYGRDFPAFIAAYEHARQMPWLADVARIERAWLDAYHAAEAPALSAAALGAVAPESLADLRLAPHPATRVVCSRCPAVAIFAMNRAEAPVTPLHSDAAEDALITRPEAEVAVRLLPPGGAVFLTGLMRGAALGEAAQAAFDARPDFDLAANIAGMIEAGAFTAMRPEDRP